MKKLYVSNKDESVRMFQSDFLEFFTKVHWTVPLILYVPVVVYFLVQAVVDPVVGWFDGVGLFLLGVFLWTIAEYLIHRFVFHYEPKSKWGQWLHFVFHGVHHDYPNDSKRLVMPPLVSIPLAFFFHWVFSSVAGPHYVKVLFPGFVLGYLCYDMLHYAIHHAEFKGKWWMELKAHHLKHHFKEPHKGFGVSTPFWDKVVGTHFRSSSDEG
ncbi:MAG: fatty acid hydroxylase [Bacteroidetes bacterium]|nr:MAG: fatty acid hydroxylase [Bacteroidota bacterium]